MVGVKSLIIELRLNISRLAFNDMTKFKMEDHFKLEARAYSLFFIPAFH